MVDSAELESDKDCGEKVLKVKADQKLKICSVKITRFFKWFDQSKSVNSVPRGRDKLRPQAAACKALSG